jgi:hypothetical protein
MQKKGVEPKKIFQQAAKRDRPFQHKEDDTVSENECHVKHDRLLLRAALVEKRTEEAAEPEHDAGANAEAILPFSVRARRDVISLEKPNGDGWFQIDVQSAAEVQCEVLSRDEVPHRAVGVHQGQVRSVYTDEGVNKSTEFAIAECELRAKQKLSRIRLEFRSRAGLPVPATRVQEQPDVLVEVQFQGRTNPIVIPARGSEHAGLRTDACVEIGETPEPLPPRECLNLGIGSLRRFVAGTSGSLPGTHWES